MILATVITNLVMALMIQKPSITVSNGGSFGISVETQYVHSVTLHEFDSLCVRNCKMCGKPIVLTPIDYLGAKPKTVYFNADELRQHEYHRMCDPWGYINPEVTNGWFKIINANYVQKDEDWLLYWEQNHKEVKQ